MKKSKRPNCFSCQYFYTTWEPNYPRGCKAYGFKTHHIPADYVLHASGYPCMKFAAKDRGTASPRSNKRGYLA